MENHTAKHFVLQLGSLASLYLSLIFLLVLVFGLINLLFPDATDSVWQIEGFSSSVRIGIAMVLVFFPTYLILTRLVNKTRRKEPGGNYLGLTKWLIYLSLLVGGAVLLGDLVAVIMGFLEGELTQRFFLKAFAVLIVVGTAFVYYLLDAKGYWLEREKKSIIFGAGVTILGLVALICGFRHIDTPAEVREQRLYQTQVNDLRDIQWRIQDYLAVNETLPESLNDIEGKLPEAPEDRPTYQYQTTEGGFQLCATFGQESQKEEFLNGRALPVPVSKTPTIVNPDNWEHREGEVCFERVIRKIEQDA